MVWFDTVQMVPTACLFSMYSDKWLIIKWKRSTWHQRQCTYPCTISKLLVFFISGCKVNMNSLPLPSKTQLPGFSPAPVKTSFLSSVTLSDSPYSKNINFKILLITYEALNNLTPGGLSPPVTSSQSQTFTGTKTELLPSRPPPLPPKLHVPHILNWRPPTASNDISWCVSAL